MSLSHSGQNVYMYMVLEFLNANGTILEFLKKINGKSSQSGRVPLIFLEILMLCIEAEKILKPYTYIHFSVSVPHFFI